MKTTCSNVMKFSVRYPGPRLGVCLTKVQYVMSFQFCGWYQVCP